MSFEPVFETVTLSGKKCEVSDRVKAECRTDVSNENVVKIINVSAYSVIKESEVNGDKIKFTGKTYFYVCYEDEGGSPAKYECATEFFGELKADCINEDSFIKIRCVTEKAEADTSGIKLSLSARVAVYATVENEEKFDFINGGENVVADVKSATFKKRVAKVKSVYPVEEEFEVPFVIQDVLSHRAEVTVNSVQCGVGSLIVDGEVLLSAILLQNGDKKDIIKEQRALPFRAELDCDTAMPVCDAVAEVSVKSFKTDISVDEEKAKSYVSASITVNIDGEVFDDEELSVCDDVFSITEEVKTERATLSMPKEIGQKTFVVPVRGKADVDAVAEGGEIVAAFNERAEIVSYTLTENGINVLGTLAATVLYKTAEGRTVSSKAETSFETLLDYPVGNNASVRLCATANNAKCQLVNAAEAEISADVVITVYSESFEQVGYVKNATSCGEKKTCDSAISVYIPMEGETLWSLSKRLNVVPEQLTETNKELQFPLTGKERIVVYRQK